jgi:hypothetical protein
VRVTLGMKAKGHPTLSEPQKVSGSAQSVEDEFDLPVVIAIVVVVAIMLFKIISAIVYVL